MRTAQQDVELLGRWGVDTDAAKYVFLSDTKTQDVNMIYPSSSITVGEGSTRVTNKI